MISSVRLLGLLSLTMFIGTAFAAEGEKPEWKYSPELLRPFWQGTTVEGESVLFIRDTESGIAKASLLFPVEKILAARNSVGDVTYEEGKDYTFTPGAREIVLPKESRIVSKTPQDLRRPAKSQKYQLTHRDGNGEVFFGARLEYAEMQTCFTYTHQAGEWKASLPEYNAAALPRTITKLQSTLPLKIALLGDSISAGANASALADAPPYQPAYPELLRRNLHEQFRGTVEMHNLAVGGTSTDWGVTQVDKIIEAKPDLVVLAFGMNDCAGRSAQEYQANTEKMIALIRAKLPETEFILVASMLGNRDWIALKTELFPEYLAALKKLSGPGIAVADVTSIWTEFIRLKKDWDQTGNGVNHPNDFGHRVYAQVLSALLIPPVVTK